MTVLSAHEPAAAVASPPARRGLTRVLAVVWGGSLLVASVGIIAHFLTFTASWPLALAAGSPYLTLLAPVALIVLGARRAWRWAAVALVVVVVAGIVQLPLWVGSQAPSGASSLTVLTANLRIGQADAAALVRAVRTHHVDVLTTQELTPVEAIALERAGLSTELPYRQLDTRTGPSGVGIWSRFPLVEPTDGPGFTFAFVTARVRVPGVAFAPVVVAAHLAGPWPQSAADWSGDIGRLPGVLQALARADPAAAVVVGADMNATFDTAQFRRVLTGGFHDASEQAGAGSIRTYPADSWLPPLLAIDHVLTDRAVATRADTVSLPGSDHRGLLVSVSLAD